MRHFIYTFSQGKPPRNGSGVKKTANVYEIQDNVPSLVGSDTDSFVDEFQLVMNILESTGSLPQSAFERNAHNSTRKYPSAYSLEAAGFAKVTRID